jgi:hypothetical protein
MSFWVGFWQGAWVGVAFWVGVLLVLGLSVAVRRWREVARDLRAEREREAVQ